MGILRDFLGIGGGRGVLGGGYNDDGGQDLSRQDGFMGSLANSLNNPIFQFGMGLASGSTPQEGFGNALGSIYARQKLAQASLTGDIKEYQFDMMQRAQNGEPRIPFAQWRQQNNANERSGMNPLFDEEGNLKVLTDKGRLITPQGAEGFKGMKSTREIDTGDEKVTINAQTGAVIARRPYNAEERAAATARGQTRGTATAKSEVALPDTIAAGEQTLDLINKAIDHPGRETATGVSGKIDPRNYIPGTDATNYQVLDRQLKSRNFLTAYEQLKGGGHISDIEGRKGEEAIARLDRAQSDGEYLAALKDLQSVVTKGVERAKQKARGDYSAPKQGEDEGWTTLPNGVKIRKKN